MPILSIFSQYGTDDLLLFQNSCNHFVRLVTTSASSLYCFNPRSACFWWRPLYFFQLLLNACTKVWHLAIARLTRSSCRNFLMARSRLCAKQLGLGCASSWNTKTKLEPLFVVVTARFSGFSCQLASISWIALARFWRVWSSNRGTVSRQYDFSSQSFVMKWDVKLR